MKNNEIECTHDVKNLFYKYGLTPKSLMTDASISIEAKALYTFLSCYADGVYPTTNEICRELYISQRTFRRAKQELEACGYLEINKTCRPHSYNLLS